MLRSLVKRRRTAAVAFSVLAVPLTVMVWVQTPVYRATARVAVENETPSPLTPAQQAPAASDATTLQTEAEVVTSHAVAEKAVVSLRLPERPALVAASSSGLRRVRDAVTGLFRRSASAPDTSATALADQLLALVSVSVVPDTRLLDISVEGTNPAFTAEAANTVARAYVQQDLESRMASRAETNTWLTERLDQQRKQVEASESALQRYREARNASSLSERQNMVVQRLGELNTAVTKAKTDRIAKEETYRQLERLQGDPSALESVAVILANPFIQTLKSDLADLQRQEQRARQDLGERHPEIVRLRDAARAAQTRLDGEIRKAVAASQSDYQAALAQENSLTEALEAQKRDAQQLDRKAVDYAALDREAVGNRQLFDAVLQEAKQSKMLTDLPTARVRVVDAARLPVSPVRPQKATEIALVLFGSAAVALVLAIGLEHMDPSLKMPEEIESVLGLVSMGYVPREQDGAATLHPTGQAAALVEAFRRIRTNVVQSAPPDDRGRVIAIASAAPREGKTTTSSSLAAALAGLGEPVVLIDADMRRGRIDTLFGSPRSPGLAEVLSGDTPVENAIVNSDVVHLSLICAGEPPANPAELLSGSRFRELLHDLRGIFTWIVVDTPPVLTVADASVIVPLADGVLFVAMADQTTREAAVQAVDELGKVQAVLIGGVLNGVNLVRDPYYYARYYRHDYENYYVAKASSPTGRVRPGPSS